MIRIELQVALSYEVDAGGADFVFNVHAAHTPHQTVVTENLQLSQPVLTRVQTDPQTGNRYLRLRAEPGPLLVNYNATVDLQHHLAEPTQLGEVPVRLLPLDALRYIYPSRYCESDRLGHFANVHFGSLWQGYSRVQAIQDWVRTQVTYSANTTDSNTSADDTLIQRVGVCRDFAHLMIALCRALNIPARFTTGTDYGATPILGPPDFHAYVEVYLGDRWYVFDATGRAVPMAFLRFGTGRDAADVAFATIFGNVTSQAPFVSVQAVNDPAHGFLLPWHCREALSTDAGRGA